MRHVGDVHPRAHAVALALERQRVVEVLRRLRVDGERDETAEVDAIVEARRRSIVWLETAAQPFLHEQAFEDVLDVIRASDHPLEPRSPPSPPQHRDVSGVGVAEPFPIDEQRNTRLEQRLPDDEPAPTA